MRNITIVGLFLLAILGVITSGIVICVKNGVSGLKLMLLGISITLFSGVIAVDPDFNLGGIEYLLAFIGLIISIVGFGKRD